MYYVFLLFVWNVTYGYTHSYYNPKKWYSINSNQEFLWRLEFQELLGIYLFCTRKTFRNFRRNTMDFVTWKNVTKRLRVCSKMVGVQEIYIYISWTPTILIYIYKYIYIYPNKYAYMIYYYITITVHEVINYHKMHISDNLQLFW